MNIATSNRPSPGSTPRLPAAGPAKPAEKATAKSATEPTGTASKTESATPASGDRVTLSDPPAAKAPSGFMRVLGRTLKNVALGTLPALATCAAMALGGASAAGLCLAGGIVGAGLVATRLLSGETDFKTAFGAGGWVGLLSGAAGMAGPVGLAAVAGFTLARQAVGEITFAIDYGHIAGKPA